jgi:hypothetical protein
MTSLRKPVLGPFIGSGSSKSKKRRPRANRCLIRDAALVDQRGRSDSGIEVIVFRIHNIF